VQRSRRPDEIGLAVIAISLAIVAVFVPASFMPSIPGQFFKQFGITVSVLVLFSLLCAQPAHIDARGLSPQAHHVAEKEDGEDNARLHARGHLGRCALRYLTVLVGFGLFAASLVGASTLPSGFLPVSGQRAAR